MKAAVIGYSLALAVALTAAYQTWTHEGDPDLSEATVILDGDRDSLERIAFDSPSMHVDLELREDELGEYVWVNAEPKEVDEPEPPQLPEGVPAPPKPPAQDTSPEAFKAGASGDVIANGMAPFVAKRVLEGVDQAKLEELGFGEEQGTLTLHREGREPRVYEVGAKAYGGSNRYVRDPQSGTVYIVASNLLDTLETAKRSLPDRTLVGFDATDIQQVTVRGGEASATFVQNNPDDRDARFWATEGTTEPNVAAAGWLDKALRLRVVKYVREEDKPSGLEEAFRFAAVANRKVVEVTVFRTMGTDGEQDWYAASAHNRALVQLHRSAAAEAFADLASVLDAGA